MASILVLDANAVERRVLRMTLEIDGHRLAEAASPADALKMLRTVPFDIVLMAIAPGRLEGYELIAQTRALGERENTQFVTVLEQNDEKGPVEAFMNGAIDILIRPIGSPDLRDLVARATSPEEVDRRDRLAGIQLEAY